MEIQWVWYADEAGSMCGKNNCCESVFGLEIHGVCYVMVVKLSPCVAKNIVVKKKLLWKYMGMVWC